MSIDMTTELSPTSLDLINAISDTEWTTHAMIADALGKPRLNPWQIETLRKLAEQGHIIERKIPRGTQGTRFYIQYRKP